MTAVRARATPLRGLASLLLVAVLPGSVAFPQAGAGGTAFYLLALLGLGLVLHSPARAVAAWRAMPELCIAPLLLVGMNLASVLLLDLPARSFSWTPLLAIPLLALVAERGWLPARALYLGGALAGALAFGVAIFDSTVNDAPRPSGGLNAIVFAQIALVAALYALAGFLSEPKRWTGLVCVAGLLAGLAATLLSGTRGTLPGIALLALLALPFLRRPAPALEPPQRRALVAGAVAIALLAGVAGQRLEVWDRLGSVGSEVAAYQEGRIAGSEIALRLALWRAALDLAGENPLLGVGAHRFDDGVRQLREQDRFPADAMVFSHAHSLPLTILAEYGAIGLAILALAAVLAWRALARAPPELRRLGRVCLLLWFVLGLSNDVFAHQSTLRVIALGLVVCAAVRPSSRSESRCCVQTAADASSGSGQPLR